jgi:outer membrane receptor for ferrienterochelin and colicins
MYCKLGNSFKLSSGYQLLYAFDKAAKNSFENGEVFARENPSSPSFELSKSDYFGLFNRSRHMANLKINYTNPISNIDSSLRIKYRSKYGLLDSNGNGYLDSYDSFVNSYVVVDLGVNKKLNNNYYIGAGIDNLLNFTDTQNITNISGRIIYAKLNIQF